MNREIIDNALTDDVSQKINEHLLSSNFPWHFTNSTVYTNRMDGISKFKFYHIVCGHALRTSPVINLIEPIFVKLNAVAIILCRVFLTTYTGENLNHGFHSDLEVLSDRSPSCKYSKTAIYYANTNNGGTLFEDGQFVNSVANRLLVFDSDDKHAAITATDVQARVVVNINYF